jgi:hypothetical protein
VTMSRRGNMPMRVFNNWHIVTFSYWQIVLMNDQKDKVPLFRSWTQWYVLVIGFLILLIILFYWLTKTFA